MGGLDPTGSGSYQPLFLFVTLSGSATLWVPSTSCPVSNCPFGRFDPSASSSFNSSMSQSFSIQYGIGEVNGTYGQDSVTVGGGLTVKNQMIGLASMTSDLMSRSTPNPSDGILGLGFPGLNSARGYSQDIPLPFNLVAQNLISQPVFSIYLDSQFRYGYSGEITFGGVDQSKFSSGSSLSYVPVMSYTLQRGGQEIYLYWTVGGQSIRTSTGANIDYGGQVQEFILDTGSTLSYLPFPVVDQIVRSLTNYSAPKYSALNGVYLVDCGLAQETSKYVEFNVYSSATRIQNLTVSVRELVIPNDADTPEQATICFFGLAPMPSSISLSGMDSASYILGESVLRSFYTVYDMGQKRIGIAKAILNPPSSSSSTSSGSSSSSGAGSAGASSDNSAAARATLSNSITAIATAMLSAVFFWL